MISQDKVVPTADGTTRREEKGRKSKRFKCRAASNRVSKARELWIFGRFGSGASIVRIERAVHYVLGVLYSYVESLLRFSNVRCTNIQFVHSHSQ